MRKLFFSFLLLFFAFACSDKKEIPKGILPKEKMEDIIWDMTRATEFLRGFVIYQDTSVDAVAENQKWYAKVFQLHKTNKAQFDKSYQYYQQHPDLMKEILDSLGKKTLPVKQALQDSVAIKDSIAKQDSITRQDSIARKDSVAKSDSLFKHRKDSLLKKIPPPPPGPPGKIMDSLKKRKFPKRKIIKKTEPLKTV